MRQPLPTTLLLWAALGATSACGRDKGPADDVVVDDSAPAEGCEELSWAQDGLPQMMTWCASCHSSLIAAEDRAGAPIGVDLESLDGVRAQLDRVIVRVEAGDMPPAGGVPEEDRARLLTWLRCGAPGAELVWPTTSPADAPEESWDQEEAVVAGDNADEVVIEAARLGWTEGLAFAEVWRVDATEAALVSREVWDEDGQPLRLITFEPPLSLWRAGQTDWSVSVERLTEDATGLSATSEEWSVSLGPATDVDPRSLEAAPDAIFAWSSAGDALELQLGGQGQLIRRVYSGDIAVEGEELDMTHLGNTELFTSADFQLPVDLKWRAKVMIQ
ncbi:hypothetical protein L6R49_06810 [Myxococcota bacterium]|nr:hypothetical protein [Myxococcota bacterium]